MQDLFKSKIFWITALSVAVVVFMIGINIQKTYTGGVDLLLLPKSEKSAIDFERIITNAEKIPLSLYFYDKLVEKYNIQDESADLFDSQRKEIWNSKIKTGRIDKSGIIYIEVSAGNQLDAKILSEQVARSLITAMSRYYNIKSDLDMRIIDGPIVSLKNKIFNIGLVLLSLVIGVIVGMIFYFFILKFNYPLKTRLFPFRLSPSIPQSQVFPELSKEFENKIEEDITVKPIIKKERSVSDSRKAFAPENLPIGDDFILNVSELPEEALRESEEIENKPKTHEATEEEIKRRLNNLLGGKL